METFLLDECDIVSRLPREADVTFEHQDETYQSYRLRSERFAPRCGQKRENARLY